MSNQVYYNGNYKYLPSTGNNIFNSNALQTIGTTATATILFQETDIQYDEVNISVDPNSGAVSIHEEGIYSFSVTLNLTDGADPVNNDIDYDSSLILNLASSITTYEMARNGARLPARGGTVGSEVFYAGLSATFYCDAGSVVTVTVTNRAPTSLKVLGTGKTVLSIQRIA